MTEMTETALSIGSNVEPRRHIPAALDALQEKFGEPRISSVFESEAVGFSGDNFHNLVVCVQTREDLPELLHWLKQLEDAHGRRRGGQRFSSRTLDVDILTYDDCVGEHAGIILPRPEIHENAFVLWPLSQVCGQQRDPHTGLNYAQLWQQYDKSRQRLWPIDYCWRGRWISRAGTPPGS